MSQEHNLNDFISRVAAENPSDRGHKYLFSTSTLLPKGVAGPILPGQAGARDEAYLSQAEVEGDFVPGLGFMSPEAKKKASQHMYAPLHGDSDYEPDPRLGDVEGNPDWNSPEYSYAKGTAVFAEHLGGMRDMARNNMLTDLERKRVWIAPALLTHNESESRSILEQRHKQD